MSQDALLPVLPALPDAPEILAVIQCAMPEEAQPILALLDAEPRQELAVGAGADPNSGHTQHFVLGAIKGRPVLVVTSGIGLTNAASATTRALVLTRPQVVIAAGTTGGLASTIEVGEIAAGVSANYHSADATAFGYAPGQVPRMPATYESSPRALAAVETLAATLPESAGHQVKIGQIVSGDSFITAHIVDPVRQAFPTAVATDMETCAMAQVCWSSGVDWVSLRAVSDLCGPSADQDFHMDSALAAAHSAQAVDAWLAVY
ncbi:MAG: 5'-methylthioadenosine/S-adenosylhomocysteine nucleosidase [Actinomycetaceae bacterium]|nr:5'-methylthioadenosine/S-adenosylhomocysteine nucleosidase [Actinomycetaceae bacterium]